MYQKLLVKPVLTDKMAIMQERENKYSFIVEVSEKNSSDFQKMINKNKCSYKQIGKTNDSNKIVVKNLFSQLLRLMMKKIIFQYGEVAWVCNK